MGILKNGMVLMNVNEYFQMVTQGLVLIAAVAFDIMMSKQKKLSKEKILEDAAK
jgi:ribose transport system permease protein